jgi:glucose-6-phosphate dehydrogenase assembly protein OpcA
MSQLPLAFPARPVDVAGIERELAKLWHEPQPGSEDKPEQVTRAVMSNLLIYCASRDQASAMPVEIAEVVPMHPARVLLLIADAGQPNDDIEAYVAAHCHSVGGGRQVFSEHITVSAGGGATRRLPSAARSLLLGDLPTALWWATPEAPPLGGPLFGELSLMADQVIYESVGWPDPVRGVLAVAEWASNELNEQVVADLQWRRLKLWRRFISQALAPEVLPEALQHITEVRLEHGPHGLPQAWLLVGWLASRLGWKPAHGRVQRNVEIEWGFQSDTGPVKIVIRRRSEGLPKVVSALIRWKTKDGPGQAHFEKTGQARLQVKVNDGEPRALAAPAQSRAALIARQLPDLERDALFLETLQHSGGMAAALL